MQAVLYEQLETRRRVKSSMQIGDVNFNIEVQGEGFPFIWGHGLMSSIASENLLEFYEWEHFPKNRMLIRYDARGHGNTDTSFSPVDYHWQNLSQDMITIANELGGEAFVAGGQSMGSATALYSALLAPERVKGLVLMNPPTAWETRQSVADFYSCMSTMGAFCGGQLLASMLDHKLDSFLPSWLIENDQIKAQAELEGIKPVKRMTLFHLFKGAAITDLPSREDISSVEVPTLILGWKDDPSHPIAIAQELHDLIPNSELVVADNFSSVNDWAELVREFVGSVKKSSFKSSSMIEKAKHFLCESP